MSCSPASRTWASCLLVVVGCTSSPERIDDAGASLDDVIASDVFAPDAVDASECVSLGAWSEEIASSPTLSEAAELTPSVTARVRSVDGGLVALRTTEMHTTFVVLVLGTTAAELVTATGTPVGEATPLRCGDDAGVRFEHHSHSPSRFAVRVPAGDVVVRYEVL